METIRMQGQPELSGNAYISARIRGYQVAIGRRGNVYLKLPVVNLANCTHETTVCETASCLNSWSLDYQFYLTRTARGRLVIDRFRLDDDTVRALAADEFRDLSPASDPFNADYDAPATTGKGRHPATSRD